MLLFKYFVFLIYSATTWTGPLGTKLTNQSVDWEQRVATFFVNGPMKLKNVNNDLTTKVCIIEFHWPVYEESSHPLFSINALIG